MKLRMFKKIKILINYINNYIFDLNTITIHV